MAGLQALRSATEQGADQAEVLQAKTRDADLHAAVQEYGALASQHHGAILGFLDELNETPNDFKDRIMEGVGNGSAEMLAAAPDADILDLAVLSGTGSGVDYYLNAFKSQIATAQALELPAQAERWSQMSQEWAAFQKKLSGLGETVLQSAASA